MPAPEPIDLRPIDLHHGRAGVVACYLLNTGDGPALFDCGPATTVGALKSGLAARGLELGDVRHLLLSHIHLDHAGAAGTLVREHPGLQVHVSEIGAPHLIEPERLERSARRLYGDSFDSLWGELVPVPRENVHVVGSTVLGLDCFPSPGHASHHVCYLDGDGTLWPATPPRAARRRTLGAAADAAARHRHRRGQSTLDEIERRDPSRPR